MSSRRYVGMSLCRQTLIVEGRVRAPTDHTYQTYLRESARHRYRCWFATKDFGRCLTRRARPAINRHVDTKTYRQVWMST